MATVTLADGRTLNMRVPMRASEIAALDAAEDELFVRQVAVMYRALCGGALDDETRAVIDELSPDECVGALTGWATATEDDALPPAGEPSSGTP